MPLIVASGTRPGIRGMKARFARLGLLLLIMAAVIFVYQFREDMSVDKLQALVTTGGAMAPILFVSVYAAGTVLFVPGSVLTIAGGAIFGPVIGTVLNLTGATIGAGLAFMIARYVAAHWVEQKSAGRLKQLKDGIEKEGWRFVVFVRLVPLFPFNLINYALGLTKVPLFHFVIASYISMLPGAFAYTYLGYAGREAVTGDPAIIEKAMLAITLLAVVAFIPRIVRRWREKPV